MKNVLQAEKLPRAIFAASDLIAIGAMRAIEEHNLYSSFDRNHRKYLLQG
ncbi:hypothetical protein [Paenibacillus sp. 843]